MFAGKTLPGVSEGRKKGNESTERATASFAKNERERANEEEREMGKVSIRMLPTPSYMGDDLHHIGLRLTF